MDLKGRGTLRKNLSLPDGPAGTGKPGPAVTAREGIIRRRLVAILMFAGVQILARHI